MFEKVGNFSKWKKVYKIFQNLIFCFFFYNGIQILDYRGKIKGKKT